MAYFISAAIWIADRKKDTVYNPDSHSLMAIFWKVTRIPYWITCIISIVYFINLDHQIGRVLIYSGYLTLACALVSVGAWLFLRDKARVNSDSIHSPAPERATAIRRR
jgi:hypothetical protein